MARIDRDGGLPVGEHDGSQRLTHTCHVYRAKRLCEQPPLGEDAFHLQVVMLRGQIDQYKLSLGIGHGPERRITYAHINSNRRQFHRHRRLSHRTTYLEAL